MFDFSSNLHRVFESLYGGVNLPIVPQSQTGTNLQGNTTNANSFHLWSDFGSSNVPIRGANDPGKMGV